MTTMTREISIHAPVKGATYLRDKKGTVTDKISIHAPVKGATICVSFDIHIIPYFNPRTREGCDK